MKRAPQLLGAIGVSLFAIADASAQEAPLPATAAPSSGQNDDGPIRDIIVTATRRDEHIHDVPGAVSAVSGAFLDSINAKSLVDFAAFTPGVSFQQTSPNTNQVVIRGVTTGTQLNSAIGLYLDDVPIGSSTPFGAGAQAINVGLFDLQRVEVLSGPQGTLFGANALGGTLRYITEAPSLARMSGQIEGEGSYTTHGQAGGAIRAALNAPLGDDIAIRLDGTAEKDPGYVDDPTHGRNNLGDARLFEGRGALLFQVTPTLSVQLNGFAESIKSNGYDVGMRDPITHQPTAGAYNQSFASETPSQSELYLGSGVIRWDLGGINLTSITAYQRTRNQSASDYGVAYSAILSAALGPAGVNPYVLVTDATTKRFTQEVRLASASGRTFEWVAGGFFSNEKTGEQVAIRNNADPDGALFGLSIGRFDLPSTARDFALFANATVHFSATFDVTVGGRQTWSHQIFSSSGTGLVVNPLAPATPVLGSGTSDQSVQTYLFNARYRPTKATLIYVRVASGYRPGGPNLQTGGAGSGNQTFASDTLWNYELGVKQTLGRGFLNLSGYHIDWTNIQQVRNIGGVNQLVNAGNARINGAEASLSYPVLPGLTTLLTAAYTDAKLTTVAPLLGLDYEGARLPLSPKFSFALAANYIFDLSAAAKGAANVTLRHVGSRNSGYPGSTVSLPYELASYNLVDANLTLRLADSWRVSPYIKNLFDVRGEVSANTITNQFVPNAPVPVTLTQPRTFGLVIGKSF
ncbi:TonB-dependent receptor [Sphingomonas sp. PAMC 26605]|uniref:TonB-dependent receptor n=1 Tax=Sphingomonas sp. PAMC 26605 TaxID=1112214 RepID=UPI000302D5D9|nr:TonB-dependent receptor [Sphingomonas sp. PAMC 26605]